MNNDFSFQGPDYTYFRRGGRVVDVTGDLTVVDGLHAEKVLTLNKAAGLAVTLPPARGSGAKYTFFVGTTVTSNSTTIAVANADDVMSGVALMAADGGDTLNAWETAADSDTITFDGSTTGGIKGDMVELVDVAANLWWVRITGSSTGAEATPFSAAV
jgi:hypothetical protein